MDQVLRTLEVAIVIIETLEVLALAGLSVNCYVVADTETRKGIVIDPGGSPGLILRVIEQKRLEITSIVNTHGHFDHIGANEAVSAATNARVGAHRAAVPLFRVQGGAPLFGLRLPPIPEPDFTLDDGDEIAFGDESLKVLHTPGHTPGCISLWSEKHGALFDGDVLFNNGIGRTDLPGGDYRSLMKSIQGRILALADETIVYPGHGPRTTVGRERRHNPFLEQIADWP